MIGLVVSQEDAVGMNALPLILERGFDEIEERVWKNGDFFLFKLSQDVIYLEGLDDIANKFDIDFFVVISRHKATKEIKTLSVHPTGNYGEARFGGREGELSYTYANGMRKVLLEMKNRAPDGYVSCMEATHHGPTKFKTPLFFSEVGATEREWNDMEAIEALVESIFEGLKRKKEKEVAIGFGGGHYTPKFTSMIEEYAFGHICPKYNADLLNLGMIDQMASKVWDGVDLACVEYNGLKGEQRRKIISWLEDLGINWTKV